MKALLIGATGATGKDVLELLLQEDYFDRVIVFTRRELTIQNKKLQTHIIDFNQPDQWKNLVKGDVLFSCLGTTLKDAGSKEAQKKVDYTYQYEFAKAARENNVENYVLVSSEMASAKSPFFYSRIKGQLEDEVKVLGFPRLIIFNAPSLVRKHSDRKMEVNAVRVLNFFNSFGLLKSMKPLPTQTLAAAMVNAVKTLGKGDHFIKGKAIWNLGNREN